MKCAGFDLCCGWVLTKLFTGAFSSSFCVACSAGTYSNVSGVLPCKSDFVLPSCDCTRLWRYFRTEINHRKIKNLRLQRKQLCNTPFELEVICICTLSYIVSAHLCMLISFPIYRSNWLLEMLIWFIFAISWCWLMDFLKLSTPPYYACNWRRRLLWPNLGWW